MGNTCWKTGSEGVDSQSTKCCWDSRKAGEPLGAKGPGVALWQLGEL